MIRQRAILKGLDRLVGGVLARALQRRRRPWASNPFLGNPGAPRRVLIIRPGGMGDAVLLIPMLRALKENFPAAQIDLLAERRNAGIFDLVPELGLQIFCYDRVRDLFRVLTARYDAVIDTEQWYRLSAVAARLIRSPVRCGFSTNERGRLFDIPVAYDPTRYEAENFLALLSGLTGKPIVLDPEKPFLGIPAGIPRETRTILIAPGASYREKRWGLEKFRGLTEWLLDQGWSVGLIGGPEDVREAAALAEGLSAVENWVGRTTLSETAQRIAAASLVVGGDSLVIHLAAAIGTPSIALFGPTPPAQWAPRGKRHHTLYHPPACSPCSRFGHIPPCPYDVDCMRRISVEEVQAAVAAMSVTPDPSEKSR